MVTLGVDDIEVVVLVVVAVDVPLLLAVPAESHSAHEQAGDPGRTPAAAAVVNRNGAEVEHGTAAVVGVEVVVHRKPWEDCNGGSRSVPESQAASRWLGTDMGSLDRLL